ncbi:hypothetical protein CsSME_00048513 [Camellia sinensis var. sinensis]
MQTSAAQRMGKVAQRKGRRKGQQRARRRYRLRRVHRQEVRTIAADAMVAVGSSSPSSSSQMINKAS